MLRLQVPRTVCERFLERLVEQLGVPRDRMTIFRTYLVRGSPVLREVTLQRSWLGNFGLAYRWDEDLAQPVVQRNWMRPLAGTAANSVPEGALVEAVNGHTVRNTSLELFESLLLDAPPQSTFVFAT